MAKAETGFNIPVNEIYIWKKYTQKKHGGEEALFAEQYKEVKCICGEKHSLQDGTKKKFECETLDILVEARTIPKLLEKWVYAQLDVIYESKDYKRDVWLDKNFGFLKAPWVALWEFFAVGGIYDALLAIMFLVTYPFLLVYKTVMIVWKLITLLLYKEAEDVNKKGEGADSNA